MADFHRAVARQGDPGKTARWVAHLHRRWVRLAPHDSLDMGSFLTTLIATRYDVDALIRPGGRSPGIRAALGALHEAGRIESLCHAVVLMLTAEGDFGTRPAQEQDVLVEVVGGELISMGVPLEHAFGKHLGCSPQHLSAVYRQSVRMLRFMLTA